MEVKAHCQHHKKALLLRVSLMLLVDKVIIVGSVLSMLFLMIM